MSGAWLDIVGDALLGATEQGPEPPRDLFHCVLDDQPSHLVPARLLRGDVAAAGDIVVNPSAWMSWHRDPPAAVRDAQPWLDGFWLQSDMVWVADPAARSLSPFWLGPRLRRALDELVPGEPVPGGLSARDRWVLMAAGVLVAADDAGEAVAWEHRAARARAAFEHGYAPLAGSIHPFLIGALRRYFRARIRTGAIRLGDDQSRARYNAHEEPVARFFHRQLAPAVCEIVARPLKPSYVYVASYRGGADLPVHCDREQCEYSVTMCVDFSPEPVAETPWPLHLQTADGQVTVYQAIGDALVYRGRQLPHFRTRLAANQSSTGIFFHYVDENFTGKLT